MVTIFHEMCNIARTDEVFKLLADVNSRPGVVDKLAFVFQPSRGSCSSVPPFSVLLSQCLRLNLKLHLMLMHITTVATSTLAIEGHMVEGIATPGFQARGLQSQSQRHSIIAI